MADPAPPQPVLLALDAADGAGFALAVRVRGAARAELAELVALPSSAAAARTVADDDAAASAAADAAAAAVLLVAQNKEEIRKSV